MEGMILIMAGTVIADVLYSRLAALLLILHKRVKIPVLMLLRAPGGAG